MLCERNFFDAASTEGRGFCFDGAIAMGVVGMFSFDETSFVGCLLLWESSTEFVSADVYGLFLFLLLVSGTANKSFFSFELERVSSRRE